MTINDTIDIYNNKPSIIPSKIWVGLGEEIFFSQVMSMDPLQFRLLKAINFGKTLFHLQNEQHVNQENHLDGAAFLVSVEVFGSGCALNSGSCFCSGRA